MAEDLTIDAPLSTLLDASPHAAPLLMELGIDPHRHLEQTLRELGRYHGIDPVMTLQVILAWDDAEPNESDRLWSDAPLTELLDHIVAQHHEYVRRQLPRIVLLLAKAVHDQGMHQSNLHEVLDVFQRLRHLLERHMIVQEIVVFPRIQELAQAVEHHLPYEGGVRQAVREMQQEFKAIGAAFDQLRTLTNHFTAPPDSSTAYQAAIEELANLDRQSQRHTHLEEFALFSRAVEMEQQLLTR